MQQWQARSATCSQKPLSEYKQSVCQMITHGWNASEACKPQTQAPDPHGPRTTHQAEDSNQRDLHRCTETELRLHGRAAISSWPGCIGLLSLLLAHGRHLWWDGRFHCCHDGQNMSHLRDRFHHRAIQRNTCLSRLGLPPKKQATILPQWETFVWASKWQEGIHDRAKGVMTPFSARPHKFVAAPLHLWPEMKKRWTCVEYLCSSVISCLQTLCSVI